LVGLEEDPAVDVASALTAALTVVAAGAPTSPATPTLTLVKGRLEDLVVNVDD